MRKQYLLALMASVVCGMSAEAQVMNHPAAARKDFRTEAARLLSQKREAPANLLRSASALRIDSVIRTNANGENTLKYRYEYTESGQVSSLTSYRWDDAFAEWSDVMYSSTNYTYDDAGRLIRQVIEDASGNETEVETTTNQYDEHGRLIKSELVSDGTHMVENYTYVEDTVYYYLVDTLILSDGDTLATEIAQLRYLNEEGQVFEAISYGYDEYKGPEDTEWYIVGQERYEYDSRNRVLNSIYEAVDKAGNISLTEEYNYTYEENATTCEMTLKAFNEQGEVDDSTYYAWKEERSGENPVVLTVSERFTKDGEWSLSRTDTYYYSGLTVANETIEDSAEPAFEAYTADGAIVITTTEVTAVQVYGMTGVCHYNAMVNGTATIANLPAGIYIMTAGGETLKIAVR